MESTISTDILENLVEKLKYEQFQDTTKKSYYSVWRTFNEFYIRLDRKPDNWEDRIILFVSYLVNNEYKSTTVRSYVSAVKAVLKNDGVEINENRYLLGALTKACRIKNDQMRTRLPIRKKLLEVLLTATDNYFMEKGQPYLAILYKALFSTAYYGLFRVGELTQSKHVLTVKDVHIGENKKKLCFVLRSSKTHNKGMKPQIVKISSRAVKKKEGKRSNLTKSGESSRYCPYQLLRDYLKAQRTFKRKHENFFVFSDRTPLKPDNMWKILHKLLKKENFEYQLYNCHLLRSGRAIDMVECYGCSMETLKKIGRWKLNIVFTYLK